MEKERPNISFDAVNRTVKRTIIVLEKARSFYCKRGLQLWSSMRSV